MKIWEQITPETWCQKAYAKDGSGKPTFPENPQACQWCALGWIAKTYPKFGFATSVRHLGSTVRTNCVSSWNDSSTFEEVREAFRKADL